MKTIVKALLCENHILEEKMSIPINKILSYRSQADTVDPEEALRYLAEMYIDNCGVSIGLRSFADYCSEYWIHRLKDNDNKLFNSKYGGAETLPDLLPFLSDEYTEEVDGYDITFMDDFDLREILLEGLSDADDEKTKIILCAGICDVLPNTSSDRWLGGYSMEKIEDAIVNLKSLTLIEYRQYKEMRKYLSKTSPLLFTKDEVRHFTLLNEKLVKLQHDVMAQVRDITLNLKEQIAKGYHQYDSFDVEGSIYIEDLDEEYNSFINILSDHAKYRVMTTNDTTTQEQMNINIAEDHNWYANWSGVFHQLEINHGLKVCRAFRKLFEDADVYTIADIMKITPEMLFSKVEIHI